MPQWRGETAAVERIGLGQQGNLLVILTLDKQTLLVVVVLVGFVFCLFVIVLFVLMLF